MNGDMERLVHQIHAARQHLGMTLKELSDLTGTSVSYLSKLENSKRSNPNLDVIKKILKALNIEEDLLDYREYKDNNFQLYPDSHKVNLKSIDDKLEFLSDRLRMNNRRKKLDADEIIYLLEVVRDIVLTEDDKQDKQHNDSE